MKLIATLIVGVFIAIVVAVYLNDNAPPHLTQQQMMLRESSEWNAHIRGILFQWSLLVLFLVGGFGALYRFLYVPALNSRERVPVGKSGMYDEVVRDMTPLHKRLTGSERKIWIHNPNMVHAPNVYATINGRMEIEASADGLSPDRQLGYAQASWGVQRAAASMGEGARPNVAMMKAAAGVYDAEARRRDAQAQLVERRLLPDSRTVQGTIEPVLNPQQALDRSSDGVVVIGQQGNQAHSLATWDTNSASTLGIFGANGTGKTSTIATMVTLAMLRWGWQLFILDGKDAGDWDEFDGHAQVMQVDRHNLEEAIETIWEEYQRRRSVMNEYRARNYRLLPPDVQAANPPWGIVFEEFGATRLRLQNKLRLHLDKFIDILCKEARYTGWHGVFIDQRPSDYTDDMKGNLKAIACFKLMMNQGHAVNAYNASKLADRGEFEMNGMRYWAFYAEPLVRSLPIGRAKSWTVHRPGSFNEPNHTLSVRDESPPDLVHEPMNHEPETWEPLAFEYLRRTPMARAIDLAEYMATVNGKTKADMKSTAHFYYRKYQDEQ